MTAADATPEAPSGGEAEPEAAEPATDAGPEAGAPAAADAGEPGPPTDDAAAARAATEALGLTKPGAGEPEVPGVVTPPVRASRRQRRANARAARRAERSDAALRQRWRQVAGVAVVLVAAGVVAVLLAQNAGALHLHFLPRPQH